jgi:hypothetical protein
MRISLVIGALPICRVRTPQRLEIAQARRARPHPPHRLVHIAAAGPVQPPQQTLDGAAAGGEIEMTSALYAVLQ